MVAAATAQSSGKGRLTPDDLDPKEIDQRVLLRGMRWKDYEVLLALRGDRTTPRMYYLEGDIELMSPSIDHEDVKTTFARLLEAYALERRIRLNGFGSWTLRNDLVARGAEPDECYVVGARRREVPDLVIEIIWTHGGLDKREIYRGLGVREFWSWDRKNSIQVYVLRDDQYELSPRSELFPDLDLAWLVTFLDSPDQTDAVFAFVDALRSGQK